jgi:hypothetical protein
MASLRATATTALFLACLPPRSAKWRPHRRREDIVAIPGVCAGQSASPSEPTLQAILSELRAIHADMRAETSRTQSMELLLADLQVSAATVTRAVERLDAARSKTIDVQQGIRHTTTDITRVEDARDMAASRK